jgi:hypothetical protein
MDLTLIAIIILAALIFVLSGMVGYLYWQQTRMGQQIQSLSLAVANHIRPALPPVHVERVGDDAEHQDDSHQVEHEEDVQETEIPESDVDDRVSVEHGVEEVERVEGPLATSAVEVDIDDLQHKTVKQLHEILTKKGIPFGKRDAKSVLIELIKATA